jgi:hypothetical protein
LEPSQEQSTQALDKPITTVDTTPGKWVKGKSGNPKGRPRDADRPRDIVTLKNDLELAVRDQLTPTRVTQIVNRVMKMALDPNEQSKNVLAAAKMILDMSVSKAHVQEAVAQRAPINIIIENATLAKQSEDKTIEAKYEVVTG